MKTIQGSGIFLAQFIDDFEPYNKIDLITKKFAALGYQGFQIPTWDTRVFDLSVAAKSESYCDEYRGRLEHEGLKVIELASLICKVR